MYGPIYRLPFEVGKEYDIGTGLILQGLDYTYEKMKYVGTIEVESSVNFPGIETERLLVFSPESGNLIAHKASCSVWDGNVDITLSAKHWGKDMDDLLLNTQKAVKTRVISPKPKDKTHAKSK